MSDEKKVDKTRPYHHINRQMHFILNFSETQIINYSHNLDLFHVFFFCSRLNHQMRKKGKTLMMMMMMMGWVALMS